MAVQPQEEAADDEEEAAQKPAKWICLDCSSMLKTQTSNAVSRHTAGTLVECCLESDSEELCSQHGVREVRSSEALARRDGSGSRERSGPETRWSFLSLSVNLTP